MYGANITSLRCNWPIPFFNDTLTWVWAYQTHQSQWLFISFHVWLQGIWAQFIDYFIHFAMKFMETYSNEFVIGNVRIKWTWTHVVDQVEVYGLYTYVIHMFDFFLVNFTLWQQNKVQCDSYKGFLLGKNGPKLPYFEETFLNLPYIACRF
jgi:hypothetical protein